MERKECGAQLRKKPGKFCQTFLGLAANGRCRLHGGKTLNGMSNPNYRHGRNSRYLTLPPRMKKDYRTALSDPVLLELKEEIALVHARAVDLVKRVDSGESGHLWKLLRQAYRDLTTARSGPDQLAAIGQIGQLITRGSQDYQAWAETLKVIDQKQRLVESERKRAVELHQTITLDRLNPMIHAIIDYVRRRVTERDGLMEFQRILEAYAGIEPTEEEGTTHGKSTVH